MTKPKIKPKHSLPGQPSMEERLQTAIKWHKGWESKWESSTPEEKKAMQKPSYAYTVKAHRLDSVTTFARRIKGQTKPRTKAHVKQQILTPEEERALIALVKASIQVGTWSAKAPYVQLRAVVVEMVKSRTGTGELGVNWVYKFLDRYPELRSLFEAYALDKTRKMEGDKRSQTQIEGQNVDATPGIPTESTLLQKMPVLNSGRMS